MWNSMTDSPLVLSLADLPQAAGSVRDRSVQWAAPADLGTPSMGVEEGTPIPVGVELTSIDDGVLVRLTTAVDLVGECVRCLDPVRVHHDVSSAEVYVEPGSAAAAEADGGPSADALNEIGPRDTIDIEPQLRDAIVTLVDARPLCRPDCPGLCDVCGRKWDELPPDHSHFQVDPRLAPLAALLGDEDGQR